MTISFFFFNYDFVSKPTRQTCLILQATALPLLPENRSLKLRRAGLFCNLLALTHSLCSLLLACHKTPPPNASSLPPQLHAQVDPRSECGTIPLHTQQVRGTPSYTLTSFFKLESSKMQQINQDRNPMPIIGIYMKMTQRQQRGQFTSHCRYNNR